MWLNMDKYILESKNLTKNFDQHLIVDNINIQVKYGEFISIMGKSGSGKSTLLNMLIGQLSPSSGDVFIESKNINKLKDKEISQIRLNKIGFIHQEPLLFEEFNVFENITLPLRLANQLNKDSKLKAENYMDKLDISNLKFEKIHALSGGERQRVSIVRALIMDPSLLIADEPTGNLDRDTKNKFMNLLQSIHKEFNLTTIIVTHDDEVAKSCDRHYIIQNQSLISTL